MASNNPPVNTGGIRQYVCKEMRVFPSKKYISLPASLVSPTCLQEKLFFKQKMLKIFIYIFFA